MSRNHVCVQAVRAGRPVLLSIIFLLFSGQSHAQKPAADAGSNLMLRSADMHFVLDLSQTSYGEAELGRLAANKAESADVKEYGRLLTDDYTRMAATLRRIATSYQATLPDEIPARQLGLRTKLQRQTGRRFDRTYMKAMVKDLKGRVKTFRKEIKKGHDQAVQRFASETLPTVEGHLEKARSLYRVVKAKPAKAPAREKS